MFFSSASSAAFDVRRFALDVLDGSFRGFNSFNLHRCSVKHPQLLPDVTSRVSALRWWVSPGVVIRHSIKPGEQLWSFKHYPVEDPSLPPPPPPRTHSLTLRSHNQLKWQCPDHKLPVSCCFLSCDGHQKTALNQGYLRQWVFFFCPLWPLATVDPSGSSERGRLSFFFLGEIRTNDRGCLGLKTSRGEEKIFHQHHEPHI